MYLGIVILFSIGSGRFAALKMDRAISQNKMEVLLVQARRAALTRLKKL